MARHGFIVKLVDADGSGDHNGVSRRAVAIVRTAPRCLDTGVMNALRQLTESLIEEYLAMNANFSSIEEHQGISDEGSQMRKSDTFGVVLHKLLRSKACHAAIKCPTELDR